MENFKKNVKGGLWITIASLILALASTFILALPIWAHAITAGTIAVLAVALIVGLLPEKAADTPRNVSKDVLATREWVTEMINSKTATCVQVRGTTIKDIYKSIHRLEMLQRSNGWVAYIYPCTDQVQGYDPTCPLLIGTLWQSGQLVARISGGSTRNNTWAGFKIHDKNDPQWKKWADGAYDLACSGPGWATDEIFVDVSDVINCIKQANEAGFDWIF